MQLRAVIVGVYFVDVEFNTPTLGVKYIEIAVNLSPMTNKIEIGEDTDLDCREGEVTQDQLNWLEDSGIAPVVRQTGNGKVKRIKLDIQKLSQLAFEYELLKRTASSVEVDVLGEFRKATDNVLTTQQLTDRTGRPKSSVSRALSRLVKKDELDKVQDGVYRR